MEGRRAGYDTFEYPIHDFTAESEKSIKIPKLNKQYGSLHISVYPPEAALYLDGQQLSTTNGVYNSPRFPTGSHYVQMRLTDYRPIRDSFTVVANQISTHEYVMDPIPLGEVSIHTDQDIGIYLRNDDGDAIFIGHTNFSGKLPAGENTVMFCDTGVYGSYLYMEEISQLEYYFQIDF